MNIEDLAHIDNFFYYGSGNLDIETQSDLMQGFVQPKRSMPGYRDYGAGVQEYENNPSGLLFDIGLRYDIAAWIAKRNQEVSKGANGNPDRRVVSSQNAVMVEENSPGELSVNVLYYRFGDLTRKSVSVKLGG